MRPTHALLLLALTGCAAAAPAPTRPPADETVLITPSDGIESNEVRITRDNYVSRSVLPASRAIVWEELPGAYADIGLPEPARDDATWTATLRDHRMTRRLGDRRLSLYFDCGRGGAAPYADSYRLFVTVTTALREPVAGETDADTRIRVFAQSTSGMGGTTGTVVCTSHGTLEAELSDALALRVAKRAAGG